MKLGCCRPFLSLFSFAKWQNTPRIYYFSYKYGAPRNTAASHLLCRKQKELKNLNNKWTFGSFCWHSFADANRISSHPWPIWINSSVFLALFFLLRSSWFHLLSVSNLRLTRHEQWAVGTIWNLFLISFRSSFILPTILCCNRPDAIPTQHTHTSRLILDYFTRFSTHATESWIIICEWQRAKIELKQKLKIKRVNTMAAWFFIFNSFSSTPPLYSPFGFVRSRFPLRLFAPNAHLWW